MSKITNIPCLLKTIEDKLKKQKNLISIVQIGSSLRKEDFNSNSDLDLLLIYKNPVKDSIEIDTLEDTEINFIKHGKKQFIKLLEEGNPVDLIALKFGKVLYDTGFFIEMKNKGFKPTEKTIERWIHTAIFNLGDAAINYSLPTCMCCYFKSLHHAAREFCRVIILKEHGELVEGNKVILEKLKTNHPDLYKKFKFIVNGKNNYERFRIKYTKYPEIKSSTLGKYLLATEDISIKALKISHNLNVPKVNKLVSQLQKKYDVDYYHVHHIIPENKQLLLHLILKGDKSALFQYNLEDGKLLKVIKNSKRRKI